MEGQGSQAAAIGFQTSLLVQVEKQFGMADDRIAGSELGVFVFNDVETMRATSQDTLGRATGAW